MRGVQEIVRLAAAYGRERVEKDDKRCKENNDRKNLREQHNHYSFAAKENEVHMKLISFQKEMEMFL